MPANKSVRKPKIIPKKVKVDHLPNKKIRSLAKEPEKPQPLSKTKDRKLTVLRKIMASARKLFIENGYENTRPQDIVNEAGIAYGSFYDYFASKRECYLAFVNEVEFEAYRIIDWYLPPEDSGQLPPDEFLRKLLRALFGFALIHPGIFRAMIPEGGYFRASDNRMVVRRSETWIARLEEWKMKGYVTSHYDIGLLADMMTALMGLGVERVTRHPEDEEQIIENITHFIVQALRS